MARQGYGKLSNDFHSNTKVKKLRRICPSAIGVYAVAISYCSDELNDGVMSEDDVLYQLDATDDEVEALLKVGLFERDDDGSYRIHDYLVHQSSREQVESKAEGARNRKRKQRSGAEVTPESREDNKNVTSMSRRDSANVTPESRCDPFNQEPRTKNQKDFSNEQSLPQTPSQAEGADEDEIAWEESTARANLEAVPRAIGYEQAKRIVDRIGEFYPPNRFRGRSYAQTLVMQSAPILKAAGNAPDVADWFVTRCRAYVDAQSGPRYVVDFAVYLKGGGRGDRKPYWQADWESMPREPTDAEARAATERERNLRDVDYLCSHWRDEECQRAALALSDKQQALARSKWPDEWYKLWRRGEQLREREQREKAGPA